LLKVEYISESMFQFTQFFMHESKCSWLAVLFLVLLSYPDLSRCGSTPLPINSSSDYLCYYGSWDSESLFRAKDFNLVILEPSNIEAQQIAELKKGHDGLAGTTDDVLVIGYLSLGEDTQGDRSGDGRGPCYWDYNTSSVVYTHAGYASWYLDDADRDHIPDMNGDWGSYYVNAGDLAWRDFIKAGPTGADNILLSKGCDGLFLDTIDTASPWSPWPYRWMVVQMSELVSWLHTTYPNKYLIANRGLFYFDPELTTVYDHTIRPYVDGVMFESYFEEEDRAYWAARVNAEASKLDGFRILALDYYSADQSAEIDQQVAEVFAMDWCDFISSRSLDEIRFDVFHRHPVDLNPPTWNVTIGLTEAEVFDHAVTLRWRQVTDQSTPVTFNIYYCPSSSFVLEQAIKLAQVAAVWHSVGYYWEYQVNGLNEYTTYSFILRVQDAQGNEDKNLQVIQATTSAGMLGDINADEMPNSTDALIILSCDVGLDVSQFCPMNCGDVNGDGFTDSTDALIILSYNVGMTVPFPMGQAGCPSSVNSCAGCNP